MKNKIRKQLMYFLIIVIVIALTLKIGFELGFLASIAQCNLGTWSVTGFENEELTINIGNIAVSSSGCVGDPADNIMNINNQQDCENMGFFWFVNEEIEQCLITETWFTGKTAVPNITCTDTCTDSNGCGSLPYQQSTTFQFTPTPPFDGFKVNLDKNTESLGISRTCYGYLTITIITEECITDSDCPADEFLEIVCFEGNVMNKTSLWNCGAGTCFESFGYDLVEECENGCEEAECLEIICTTDTKQCEDGSYVSRNPDNNCEFYDCPIVPPTPWTTYIIIGVIALVLIVLIVLIIKYLRR